MSPRFILLDEPFAGIDPIAVTDIQKIIFHLKERGIGVLITDHNVRETLAHHGSGLYRHRRGHFQERHPESSGRRRRGSADLSRDRFPAGLEFRKFRHGYFAEDSRPSWRRS